MSEELIDNLIEEIRGAMPIDEGDDIGGGTSKRSKKNRTTTQSTKDVYLKNLLRLNNKQPIKIKKNGEPNYD
jgi:hypothetical protein